MAPFGGLLLLSLYLYKYFCAFISLLKGDPMSYWQAYKKVLSTNLKVTGVVALIVALMVAVDYTRKHR